MFAETLVVWQKCLLQVSVSLLSTEKQQILFWLTSMIDMNKILPLIRDVTLFSYAPYTIDN